MSKNKEEVFRELTHEMNSVLTILSTNVLFIKKKLSQLSISEEKIDKNIEMHQKNIDRLKDLIYELRDNELND